jgi:hypothetical protein
MTSTRARALALAALAALTGASCLREVDLSRHRDAAPAVDTVIDSRQPTPDAEIPVDGPPLGPDAH